MKITELTIDQINAVLADLEIKINQIREMVQNLQAQNP